MSNNSVKCPVTKGDKLWVDENIQFIFENLLTLSTHHTIDETIILEENQYDKTEEGAEKILHRIAQIYGIDVSAIELIFYNEEELELSNGMVSPSKNGTAGLYVNEGGRIQIWLEINQLNFYEKVIATIAHELSHYDLLEIKKVSFEGEENEFFTDLYTIAKGFGIFLGNTKCVFDSWEANGRSGWSYSNQGYLPLEVISYAMARIEFFKNNIEIPWEDYMTDDFGNLFYEGLLFLYEQKKKNTT